MIEKKTKELGGIEFTYLPLMAGQARLMLDKLINSFGGVLSAALTSSQGIDLEAVKSMDIDTTQAPELIKAVASVLGGGVGAFSKALTPDFHEELVNIFLNQVKYVHEETGETRGLTKNVREVMFSTRLALETQVLLWCISEQYGDFFEPVRKLISSIPQAGLAQTGK